LSLRGDGEILSLLFVCLTVWDAYPKLRDLAEILQSDGGLLGHGIQVGDPTTR